MHQEQRAFLDAIAANPDDDLPRLVYADWLDEHAAVRDPGQAAGARTQAEFIRAGCQLARVRSPVPDQSAPLVVLCQALARRLTEHLFGPDLGRLIRKQPHRIQFDRGLLARLDLSGTGLRSLPDGLFVCGDLSVSDNPLAVLPNDLFVAGSLTATRTSVTDLPRCLRVGEFLAVPPLTSAAARALADLPGLSETAKETALEFAGHPDLLHTARRLPTPGPTGAVATPTAGPNNHSRA